MTTIKRVHTAVGVAITDKKRNLFFIQQKDESYPIPELRLNFTFFGGRLNDNEDEKDALKRELLEELDQEAAILIYEKSKKMFDIGPIKWKKWESSFCLYEAVLPIEKLIDISKLPVKEGEKGCLVTREEIVKLPLVPTIKETVKRYLSNFDSKLSR